jgi:hypothetical protein
MLAASIPIERARLGASIGRPCPPPLEACEPGTFLGRRCFSFFSLPFFFFLSFIYFF